MIIPLIAIAFRVCWLVVEYPHLRRTRVRPAKDWDRQSANLWDAANAIELIGIGCGLAGWGSIQFFPRLVAGAGLGLLVLGIGIRWAAIRTLGQYFTTTVVIKKEHRLIRQGLYKYVRHPAYTGTLLAHLGLGLSFASWWTLAFSSLPFVAAAVYRMHVEEEALRETFGSHYTDYARSANRLVPGLF